MCFAKNILKSHKERVEYNKMLEERRLQKNVWRIYGLCK